MVYRERNIVKGEVKAKCTTKLENVKKYLAGREEQDGTLLTLSQVFRTYDCLKVLAKDGLAVPEAVLDKLSVDKTKLEADLSAVDVVELEDGNLEMSPPPPPRSRFRNMSIVLPPGVNQHGSNVGVIFSNDAANLRNQSDS